MSTAFEQLGLSQPLAAGVGKEGIVTPTDIQTKVIPAALAGKDIVGQSATGTGKTLAYLLPLFQRIEPAKGEVQGLILAPTHELAIQIQRQIERLATNAGVAIASAPLIGGANINRQIDKLKERPQIVVGSSGRILELIQKKKINPQTIRTVVLDEADRLLDDQNITAVQAILKTTLKERQVMLFSATITAVTLKRAEPLLREPQLLLAAAADQVAPSIEHLYFRAEQRDKIEVLRKLMHALQITQALVFINNSYDIEKLTAKLNHHGLKAAGLHGTIKKAERKKTMEDFRKGAITLLVASDLAARGLDVPGVAYVINLDLPEEAQLYLHRVGRTGRAGEKGTAISIATPREVAMLGGYERALAIKIAAKEITHGKVREPFRQSSKTQEKIINAKTGKHNRAHADGPVRAHGSGVRTGAGAKRTGGKSDARNSDGKNLR